MEMIAPSGPVYQAGTLSGNPLAMAAGYEMLMMLSRQTSMYTSLEKRSHELEKGIRKNLKELGLDYQLNRVGSMFTLFFTEHEVIDYETATRSDTKKFAAYFREMLQNGIYLPPSQFEAAFVSMAHRGRDIERTLAAQHAALKAVKQKATY